MKKSDMLCLILGNFSIAKIKECFERGKDSITEILSYLFDLSRNLISNRRFRTEIVNTLIEAYARKDLQPNDYPILCQCHFFLGQHEPVSKLLHELLHSEKEVINLCSFFKY
jgi:hypothetical protein